MPTVLPEWLLQGQPTWVALVLLGAAVAVWLSSAVSGVVKSVSDMRKVEGEREMAVRNHRAGELKAAIDRATKLQADLTAQDRAWQAAYSDQRDEILALHARNSVLKRDLEASEARESRLMGEMALLKDENALLKAENGHLKREMDEELLS